MYIQEITLLLLSYFYYSEIQYLYFYCDVCTAPDRHVRLQLRSHHLLFKLRTLVSQFRYELVKSLLKFKQYPI